MILTWFHAKVAAGVLAVCGAGYGGYTLVHEHDARVKAESVIQANEQISKDADAKIKAVNDEMEKRDQASADREKALIDAVAKLKTPAQIVPYVASNLAPAAPVPIIVTIPAATASNPTPNAVISIPQVDLPAVRDRLNSCDITANALTTCQADAISKTELLRQAGIKLSAAENERDAVKLELKGGTFWRRTKTALMWIGIGAGAAAAGVCGSGHCK
jgi:hypothetical protein